MSSHDWIADLLTGAHGLADSGNVGVVPGVVVDQGGTVSHTTNLVAVIPPRHDLGGWLGVLAQPVVSLTVVINDVLRTVGKTRSQDNGRGGVSVGGDPGAVEHEQEKVGGDDTSDGKLGGVGIDADQGLGG